MSQDTGSTAPALDLKGVEVAATLVGLSTFESLFVEVKYIGEKSQYPALLNMLTHICVDRPNINIAAWLRSKPRDNVDMHMTRFQKAIPYVLDRHLGDYRCQVCQGSGFLYTFGRVCAECGGGGVSKMNMHELGRKTSIKKGWAYANRAPIHECRDILIRTEISAIQKINHNSR